MYNNSIDMGIWKYEGAQPPLSPKWGGGAEAPLPPLFLRP